MSINSVNNFYAAQAYGLDFNTLSGKTKNSGSANASAGGSSSGKAGAGGLGSVSPMLSEILSSMGLGSGDKVTFQDLLNYREDLQKDFEEKTKAGLRKLGVDENVKFQLVSDGKNGIKVISESEDKAAIEKFFKDNPEMVTQFNKIEALTNVEAARKTQSVDVKATRKRIEVESMTAWFAGTGQSVSSILDFTGGQSALYSGLNKTV